MLGHSKQNRIINDLLFSLHHLSLLVECVAWSGLLENAGHSIIQAAVLFPADGLGVLVVITHVMLHKLVRCSSPALVAIPARPASPVPATSLTDRAAVASRSSYGYRHGLALGTHLRRA